MKAKELTEAKKTEMEVLKANKIPLDDDERKKVMDAGAVWHHGKDGAPSPAVWKSKNSAGKIKYVCNTHRTYQVSDTLAAGIKSYESVERSA